MNSWLSLKRKEYETIFDRLGKKEFQSLLVIRGGWVGRGFSLKNFVRMNLVCFK